jgi:hypothetical protein
MWRAENIVGGTSFTVQANIGSASTLTLVAWCLTATSTPTSYNGDPVGAPAGGAPTASGTSTPAPSVASFFLAGMTGGGGDDAGSAGSGWQFVTGSTQPNNSSFQDLYTEQLVGDVSISAQNGEFGYDDVVWAARVASFASSLVVGGNFSLPNRHARRPGLFLPGLAR